MTTAIAISRRDIQSAIRDQYLVAVGTRNGWHYTTVWPSGAITHGAEASPHYPQDEYFAAPAPRPCTVWSIQGTTTPHPQDVYEWEECRLYQATFWADQHGSTRTERDDRHVLPRRLTDVMQEDLDWEMIMPDVERMLDEAGYMLED